MTYPSVNNSIAPYPSAAQFPQIGEKTVLYLDLSTNTLYSFDGSVYGAINGVVLPADVLNVLLTGLNVTTAGAIVNTDSVLTGFGKAQKQINDANTALAGKEPTIAAGNVADYWRGDKTWRNLATDVRAALLTGLSTATNAVITASDSVLSAFGKIQAQVSALLTSFTDYVNSNSVSVFAYMTSAQIADVKAGTLTLDVTAAFTAALATGRPVFVPGGTSWKYLIGSTITIPSNSFLYSRGAQLVLANNVNNHVLRIADSADNVTIEGLAIVGNKSNNSAGNGISASGGGCTNIKLRGNIISLCKDNGIFISGTTVNNIDVSENRIFSCDAAGAAGSDTITKFVFERNFCYLNGTYGLGLIGIGKDGTITGNVCWNNGQGVSVADGITFYNVANEKITVSGNVCIGGGNNGMHVGGDRITVSSNVVVSATFYGIVAFGNTGTNEDISISNNVVYSNGLSGVWVQNYTGGSIVGNTINGNTQHGILIDACVGITFSTNTIRENGVDGIRNNTASSNLVFTSNSILSNLLSGFRLDSVTQSILNGNIIRLNAGYGINTAGTENNNIISNNIIRNNTAGAYAAMGAADKIFGNDDGTAGVFAIKVPSGADGLVITNSSLSGTRGWEFYPTTNGTDTDMNLYEFAGTSGNRAVFKSGGTLQWLGDLQLTTAGKGLGIKSGTNCKAGSDTLVAGTKTVSNTSVTANSIVILNRKTAGGTTGDLSYTISAGSSFTINSTSNTDTSTIDFLIFEKL